MAWRTSAALAIQYRLQMRCHRATTINCSQRPRKDQRGCQSPPSELQRESWRTRCQTPRSAAWIRQCGSVNDAVDGHGSGGYSGNGRRTRSYLLLVHRRRYEHYDTRSGRLINSSTRASASASKRLPVCTACMRPSTRSVLSWSVIGRDAGTSATAPAASHRHGDELPCPAIWSALLSYPSFSPLLRPIVSSSLVDSGPISLTFYSPAR